MVAITESKVGKFKFTVQASKEAIPKAHDRVEAIANWLLKQWQNRNNETKEQS
ncbi:MAG: hypothetical protein ISS71_06010 [Phycisphaerae bacterium]|nr:hypothetical protein [Phycisphaerae bacterium]